MADRALAERHGRRAEDIAAALLRAKAYSILDRRARTARGEIDIVARRGRTLVFVEVKLRARIDDAVEAVWPRSWERIGRAGEAWAARRAAFAGFGQRFDLIALAPWRLPIHVRDAWRPDFAARRF